ncbi:MAG: 5'-nucleotidase C-terminal domain-containing protein [Pseudomonadota bacterium]
MKKILLFSMVFLFFFPSGPCLGVDWNLIVLTTSNLNGQLETFTIPAFKDGEKVDQEVGGAARLVWTIQGARKKFPDKTLLVSVGDDFAGPFFVYGRGKPISDFMNKAGYDAAALGNREFDYGEAVLAETLNRCRFPYIVSNLVLEAGGPLAGLVHKYRVIEKNGLRIGVFGLMGKELAQVSCPGPSIRVAPDYDSACREAVRFLREEEKVDLVLGLFHISGVEARDLASRVPGMDVICVGKTNVVTERGREWAPGPDGGGTVVIEPEIRGKYLGLLKLEVKAGKVVNYFWAPIPMESSLPEDPETAALVSEAVKQLPAEVELAGTTETLDLRKPALRTVENPFAGTLGDLLRRKFRTDAALLNSGGIRGDKVIKPGPITTADLEVIFPFTNTLTLLTVTGKVLRSALELGVSNLPEQHGRFPQVAGLRYEIDPSGPPMELVVDSEGKAIGAAKPGGRIKSVEVLGADSAFHPLDPEKEYTLITSSFIAKGGDGYFMLAQVEDRLETDLPIKEAVEDLLKREKTISPKADGRIRYVGRL